MSQAEVTIYHNPRCSKSRQTLELIKQQGITPNVVEYLSSPPDATTLKDFVKLLDTSPRGIMRTKEAEYKDNTLNNPNLSDDDLIKAITEFPKLLERPIVLCNGKAAIGRPPENILAILP